MFARPPTPPLRIAPALGKTVDHPMRSFRSRNQRPRARNSLTGSTSSIQYSRLPIAIAARTRTDTSAAHFLFSDADGATFIAQAAHWFD
ncbi:hypothetical protein A0H81_08314 [Grifola frondosa]|uniref:Uncharacterized protein n=1 Tax=Grifola frondosa TaxID=5627 RepID=A0A1C7M8M1_GRIFR|nr:hypothetical protein A0H81_08314 [Grifola frondosa]